MCSVVRKNNRSAAILVNNCYGEFVEEKEPTRGGAPSGGGFSHQESRLGWGCRDWRVSPGGYPDRSGLHAPTAPGIGRECGATLGQNRALYQGLFSAPHTVAQAVKTAVFAAKIMELLGYRTEPTSDAVRHDIIQMIHFGEPEPLEAFPAKKGIQFGAPVGFF